MEKKKVGTFNTLLTLYVFMVIFQVADAKIHVALSICL